MCLPTFRNGIFCCRRFGMVYFVADVSEWYNLLPTFRNGIFCSIGDNSLNVSHPLVKPKHVAF